MELIKCNNDHTDIVTSLYHRTIKHLEENINYPKWSSEHPSDNSIAEAIKIGEQYVCCENGRAIGAVVLSENPDGYYEAGNWSKNLNAGEYLVIHALAVDPSFEHKGVGSFIMEKCIDLAREGGYKALRLDVVPGNIPAERLYRKIGFISAGTKDLKRNIPEVPVFDLFELNLVLTN